MAGWPAAFEYHEEMLGTEATWEEAARKQSRSLDSSHLRYPVGPELIPPALLFSEREINVSLL